MNAKTSVKSIGLSGVFVLLLFFAFVGESDAQSQSLSIYPPVIEVQATPPSSPTAPIVIHNNNVEDVSLRIELIPIKQADATGQILLQPQLMSRGFYSYYADRIQFLVDDKKTETIDLEALETKEVIININLEKGDPPGDYYYSVVFISKARKPDKTSTSSIPTGIASNLLLSVGPKSQASGGITEFTTGSFKNSGPVEFNLKLHNASQHLIEPQGSIEIFNLFGKKVGVVEILPQFILSNSDRYLIDESQATAVARLEFDDGYKPKIVWPEKFLLGFYKAKALIQLEPNGKKIEAITYFLAFPLYVFFALAIVIFISLSIYFKVRKKI